MPKLSIITINLNNEAGLRKTLESVVCQTSRSFEHIIIDGGSTDGSVDVIQSFTTIPPNTYTPVTFATDPPFHTPCSNCLVYWVSEDDHGIYHAMNKGVQVAKGEYCQFLNSGDWLADNNVVKNMLNEINSLTTKDVQPELGPDILVGNGISVRPNGKVRFNRNEREVSFFTFYRGTLHHTSAYIRKALFYQYGMYDESLKIVADWKWYLIVAGLNKANVQFTDTYVTYFDTSGISSTQLELDKSERQKVLKELLPSPILSDYDKFQFDILQMQRMKKKPLLYGMFWFIERCLFKIEKWNLRHFGWKHKR